MRISGVGFGLKNGGWEFKPDGVAGVGVKESEGLIH